MVGSFRARDSKSVYIPADVQVSRQQKTNDILDVIQSRSPRMLYSLERAEFPIGMKKVSASTQRYRFSKERHGLMVILIPNLLTSLSSSSLFSVIRNKIFLIMQNWANSMFWDLILSFSIWTVLDFILCSIQKCTEMLVSPYSKCRSHYAALSVTDLDWTLVSLLQVQIWKLHLSSKIWLQIKLKQPRINHVLLLSNHMSVVMESYITIFAKVTCSAELFIGIGDRI